jgi:hypothetical protein
LNTSPNAVVQIRPGQHRQQAEQAPQQALDKRQQHLEMVSATLLIPQPNPAHSTNPSFRAEPQGHEQVGQMGQDKRRA